jgi:hypothetical protein
MPEMKGKYHKEYYRRDPYRDFLYKDDSRLLDEERYRHEHYIPAANRLLALAAKGTWIVMKEMAKVAIRVPQWFVRANTPRPDERRDDRVGTRGN